MFNVSPDVELKSKRVGSTTYQIPCAISVERKLNIGIKQFIQICKLRKENTMIERVTAELIDSYKNKGMAVKKKDEIKE